MCFHFIISLFCGKLAPNDPLINKESVEPYLYLFSKSRFQQDPTHENKQ